MSPTHNHPRNPKRWREDPELPGPAAGISSLNTPTDSSSQNPRSILAQPQTLHRKLRIAPSLIGFLTSLIAHTAFLIFLALIVIQGLQGGHNNLELHATIQPDGEALDGSQLASVVISPPQLDAQESRSDQVVYGEDGNIQNKQPIATELGELRRFQPEQAGTDDAAYRLQDTVAQLALVSATSDNQPSEAESGKPGQATFFGAKAYGNRFVFIIDASTSMEGYRWNRALGELIKSVDQLAEGTEFFIIAFHYEPVPIDLSRAVTKSFLVKGKGSVVLCRKWLRSLVLAPDTRPASSLELALAFEPDAIFLLSDGELRDNSLAMLRNKNQQDDKPIIPINTIHLFSNDGKETLETLAKENGGSFTAVGGKE
jgi:hypothetical protein